MAKEGPRNLEQMLDMLARADTDGDGYVSIADVQRVLGARAVGPLLLAVGLAAVSPLTAIPAVPTTIGVLVILLGVQVLLSRDIFWLPAVLGRRHVAAARFAAAVAKLRPAARFVDKLLRPRLKLLSGRVGTNAVAPCCIGLGLLAPPFELLPLLFIVPSFAIAAFGLALLARDGLVALVGFALSAATFALAARLVGS